MATMPNLIDFSLAYANAQMDNLGITPVITYQTISPPTTPGVVTAQSPSAGSTISGQVSFTVTAVLNLTQVGPSVFSQPSIYVQDIAPPG